MNLSSEPLKNRLCKSIYTQALHFCVECPSDDEFMKDFGRTKLRLEALLETDPHVLYMYIFTLCSTYMQREGDSKHVAPFSQGLYLSTQRNPVEN